MKFTKIDLDLLLGELTDLPSEWLDDEGRRVLSEVPSIIEFIRELGGNIDTETLATLLEQHPFALDVLRLISGESQEPMAHRIFDVLGGKRRQWTALRSLARRNPREMAAALTTIGLPALINEQVARTWTIQDVVIERYKLGRGRAIVGQNRGRGLENEVEAILREIPIPFESRVTFKGPTGVTAKCDFAIPMRDQPKIVIEVKGYEATGSKLTDFLGDILKIKQAKGYHTYLLVVTDGRGWLNRKSDLKRLVDLHLDGTVEMIYTRPRLSQLAADVRHIFTTEQ